MMMMKMKCLNRFPKNVSIKESLNCFFSLSFLQVCYFPLSFERVENINRIIDLH